MGSKQEFGGSGEIFIGLVVSHCQRGTFVALVNVSYEDVFRLQFHLYLKHLDGVVSQLLVELPRTVKGI